MARIAYFEPVEGLRVYGRELLPELWQQCQVDVYTSNGSGSVDVGLGPDAKVRAYDDFHALRREYDHLVFQLRNNSYHVPVYDLLMRYGGVAVLHDINLSGIIGAKTLLNGRKLAFLGQVLRQEGLGSLLDTGLGVVLHKRWPSQDRFMMNKDACRQSRGVIVHNEYALRAIEPHAGGTPVQIVRRGVPLRSGTLDVAGARQRVKLPVDAFVAVSLGHVTRRKRITEALAAFARLVQQVPDALYILVGRPEPGFDVEAHVSGAGLEGRVELTGWVGDDVFYDYLEAADVCINLRYPVEGETSSTALRAMSYSKPTLVSDAGSLAELPSDACIKITPGADEVAAILEALRRMQNEPQERHALGERAARYVREHHTWAGASQTYWRFLQRLSSQTCTERI